MTTPDERTRAVLETRSLLQQLATKHKCHNVAESDVALLAARLLRHYPRRSDIDLRALALPIWWSQSDKGSGYRRSHIPDLAIAYARKAEANQAHQPLREELI